MTEDIQKKLLRAKAARETLAWLHQRIGNDLYRTLMLNGAGYVTRDQRDQLEERFGTGQPFPTMLMELRHRILIAKFPQPPKFQTFHDRLTLASRAMWDLCRVHLSRPEDIHWRVCGAGEDYGYDRIGNPASPMLEVRVQKTWGMAMKRKLGFAALDKWLLFTARDFPVSDPTVRVWMCEAARPSQSAAASKSMRIVYLAKYGDKYAVNQSLARAITGAQYKEAKVFIQGISDPPRS